MFGSDRAVFERPSAMCDGGFRGALNNSSVIVRYTSRTDHYRSFVTYRRAVFVVYARRYARLTKSVATMESLWRRVFLVSLLLLGLLSGGVSDDIGGSYYWNHTISLSGSPYSVTDEIIVGEAATLTIEPGVRLLFPEGVGMTVWGRLIASWKWWLVQVSADEDPSLGLMVK
ncbi:hypothetical protein Bbelb_352420 [Branchiostoma belcheri]|nr:hypothetical protein Bbelb_352420 [Branchiostoma belcheri]